jgi:pre-mRNA-splicing factor 18
MDFASLMSAEISKARPTTAPPGTASPTKKYQKRSEVEAERRGAYLASQRALEAEKEDKAAQKRKREEEEADAAREREEKRRRLAEESRRSREEAERKEERVRRKRLGLPELVEEARREEVVEDDVPDEELVDKLRKMGEPARLFGESHKARLKRFRKLGVVMTKGPIPTSLELVEEKDMKVGSVPKDAKGKKYLFRQLASYFTMVLREWEEALGKEKRDTFASKAAYNAMVQSKENMTPVRDPRLSQDIFHETLNSETDIHSCSASSRKEILTKASSSRSWKSSKQHRNVDTSTPTMAISV